MLGTDDPAVELVRFCSEFDKVKLAENVLEAARRHILDFIGVGLGGQTQFRVVWRSSMRVSRVA